MTTTLRPRTPEDLLAIVPLVLGFHPEESLAMLTFGGAHSFHARLDLPPPDDQGAVTEAVDVLLSACRTHRVERVAFIAYTADSMGAARLAATLVPAFVADGFGVVDVIRAHDSRWCSVPLRADADEPPMTPYDPARHAYTAQAVFEGRVTLGSRAELRSTIAPDPDVRARWARLIDALPEPGPADVARGLERLAEWVSSGDDPDDEAAARLLRAVTRLEVRDSALYAVTRDTARDHLRVWSALARGAPDAQVPDTTAVVAFCAWLSGDGALAWCALDRCFEVDPDHGLGTCLAECLVRALPPTVWEGVAGEDERRADAG